MKKSFLLTILCISLAICAIVVPITVSAATEGMYTYTVSDGKATITAIDTSISEDIIIPNMLGETPVTNIGENAFFNNRKNLTSITIPDTITTIGTSSFNYCEKLTSINVNENNSVYSSIDGILFDKEKKTLVRYPKGKKDISYSCPLSVTSISKNAFYDCENLSSITLGNNVTTIGNNAFYDCENLSNIDLGSNLRVIGSYAFEFCFNLTSIDLGNNVTTIGIGAFEFCKNITQINIPESVTSIGEYAFDHCHKLVNINVNENNSNYSSVNGILFNKKQKTLIRYPEGKTEISYSIPIQVTHIGCRSFGGCKTLETIEIHDNVTTIEAMAFYDCTGLKSIKIPDKIKRIEHSTFSGCTGLINISIPNSIAYIERVAFHDCINLTTVFYSGSENDWNLIEIENSGNDKLISSEIEYNHKEPLVNVEITNATSTENSLKFVSKVAIDGNPEILTFGTTFIPLWLFETGSTNIATVQYDNSKYNIQDGQTFGTTLSGIPDVAKDMQIVGKSFIKDADGNYIWSTAKSASINNTTLTELE